MLIVLSVAMFIVPSMFSLTIHDYLRHGEVPARKKTILFSCATQEIVVEEVIS